MAALYQKYLAEGPLSYMEILFAGMTGHAGDARQLALDFYEPIFLLYSIRDGMENPQEAVEMLDRHVRQFAARMRKSQNDAESGQDSKS